MKKNSFYFIAAPETGWNNKELEEIKRLIKIIIQTIVAV